MSRTLYHLDTTRWSVERVVFALAGALVSLFTLLGFFAHAWFHFGALFIGGMLIFFSLTGYCPSAMLIYTLQQRKK